MTDDPEEQPAQKDVSAMLSTVRDQGPRETCLSCAVTTVHEYVLGTSITTAALSEEYLHWSSRGVRPHSRGRSTYDIEAALRQTGQPPYERWPYDPRRDENSLTYTPPDLADSVFAKGNLTPIALDIRSLRKSVSDGRVVVLGLSTWLGFHGLHGYDLDVPDLTSILPARHAVVCAGYDDVDGYLVIRNSWGRAWGRDGCARMTYGTWNLVGIGAWVVEAVGPPKERRVDLNEYQTEAARSDQFADRPRDGLVVALLGLAGETGTLLATHKKRLRDRDAYEDYRQEMAEDLGDLLWYLAATASRFGFNLTDLAAANLKKVRDRWPQQAKAIELVDSATSIEPMVELTEPTVHGVGLRAPTNYDAGFPPNERFARQFAVALAPVVADPRRVIGVLDDGTILGDQLGDNAPFDDGYRWHDTLHFAHVAILGWSPVIRGLLHRKRKSSQRTDDVDDGGRAIAIEEGITAFTFEYAAHHRFLDGVETVDTDLLRTIKKLTSLLEVGSQTMVEWQAAILGGFAVWRHVREHDGGLVIVDMDTRSLTIRDLTAEERLNHAETSERALVQKAARKAQRRALERTAADEKR